jgi:hypothetical protein
MSSKKTLEDIYPPTFHSKWSSRKDIFQSLDYIDFYVCHSDFAIQVGIFVAWFEKQTLPFHSYYRASDLPVKHVSEIGRVGSLKDLEELAVWLRRPYFYSPTRTLDPIGPSSRKVENLLSEIEHLPREDISVEQLTSRFENIIKEYLATWDRMV